VLDWLKNKLRFGSNAERIALQPPGVIFPWPKEVVLTAIDETVFALPQAIFEDDRPIGEFVFGPADMEINIPLEGDTFFVRVQPGMSVSLSKSCQSYVVAEDHHPRRVKMTPQRKKA
jgi:hypothetical protein